MTFIAVSQAMQTVERQIRRAAATSVPVLLQGETGTGRDTVAHLIHSGGARADGPFLTVNLRLPADPAATLFGRAQTDTSGAFEAASGGTVFLDALDVAGEGLQIGILRVIEERRTVRAGGDAEIPVDVRIVASANQDLGGLAVEGAFREDLLFRLGGLQIRLPALRDRIEDIPLLAAHFFKEEGGTAGLESSVLDEACLSALLGYRWPGNVRDLRNVVRSAVAASGGKPLGIAHLPERVRGARSEVGAVLFEVGTPLHEVERVMIERTLKETGGNRKRAAELLGISRRSLYNKLDRYALG